MAVPKQRISKARTRRRKSANMTAKPPTYATCPRCHAWIRPHHVCANCGQYKGRTAVDVE